jgi:ribosomal-protein-alanine N-acetyltransferase
VTIQPLTLAPDILLRPITLADAAAMVRAYDRNRAHLAPWDPIREPEFFTEVGQAMRLRQVETARAEGRGERWVLTDAEDEIVGSLALSAIEHGPFRNARLGYWVDGGLAGRGLITAAVGRICRIASDVLGLHRIEAGTLLENAASQRVLTKCGFEEFGLARKYLQINGAWRDHRMFQRILFDDEG